MSTQWYELRAWPHHALLWVRCATWDAITTGLWTFMVLIELVRFLF